MKQDSEFQKVIKKLIQAEKVTVRDHIWLACICLGFSIAIYIFLASSIDAKKDKQWWEPLLGPFTTAMINIIGLPKPAEQILSGRRKIRRLEALSTCAEGIKDDKKQELMYKIVDDLVSI